MTEDDYEVLRSYPQAGGLRRKGCTLDWNSVEAIPYFGALPLQHQI